MVRTFGLHPRDKGSIPLGTTKNKMREFFEDILIKIMMFCGGFLFERVVLYCPDKNNPDHVVGVTF